MGHLLVLQHHEHDWSTHRKPCRVETKSDQRLFDDRELVMSQLRESVQMLQQIKEKYQQIKVEVQKLESKRSSYIEFGMKNKVLMREIEQLEVEKCAMYEQIRKNHFILDEQKTLMLRQQESLKALNKSKIKDRMRRTESEEHETDASSSFGSRGIKAQNFLVPIIPTLVAIALGILALNYNMKDNRFMKEWIK